jgi:hypothetical protein
MVPDGRPADWLVGAEVVDVGFELLVGVTIPDGASSEGRRVGSFVPDMMLGASVGLFVGVASIIVGDMVTYPDGESKAYVGSIVVDRDGADVPPDVAGARVPIIILIIADAVGELVLIIDDGRRAGTELGPSVVSTKDEGRSMPFPEGITVGELDNGDVVSEPVGDAVPSPPNSGLGDAVAPAPVDGAALSWHELGAEVSKVGNTPVVDDDGAEVC